jgi:hypothetical protein
MSSRVLAVVALLAGLALVIGGCGGTDACRVSGEVTFNGQPVKTGAISFEPIQGQAQARSAAIRDGRYETEGKPGIPPGSYLVRLSAPDLEKTPPVPANVGPNDYVPPAVPLLPPMWNVQSKLTVELKLGKNVFHFRGNKGEAPRVEPGS